jgi:hypothetical protein
MPTMALMNQYARRTPIIANNPMKTFVGILSISFNANKIINGMKQTMPSPFVGKTSITNRIIPNPRRVKSLTGFDFSSTLFLDF